MSMEDAILAHANALLVLAEALSKVYGANGVQGALNTLAAATSEEIIATVDGKAAELAEATGKRATAAKEAQAKDAKANADAKAAADKAQEQTGDAGNANTGAASSADAGASGDDAGTGADEAVLDYNKEVKPRLLAVVKKVGKEKLAALIQTYGVAKAEAVDPTRFADLLTKAEALEK